MSINALEVIVWKLCVTCQKFSSKYFHKRLNFTKLNICENFVLFGRFKWKVHWLLKVENRWCMALYGKVYGEKCKTFMFTPVSSNEVFV